MVKQKSLKGGVTIVVDLDDKTSLEEGLKNVGKVKISMFDVYNLSNRNARLLCSMAIENELRYVGLGLHGTITNTQFVKSIITAIEPVALKIDIPLETLGFLAEVPQFNIPTVSLKFKCLSLSLGTKLAKKEYNTVDLLHSMSINSLILEPGSDVHELITYGMIDKHNFIKKKSDLRIGRMDDPDKFLVVDDDDCQCHSCRLERHSTNEMTDKSHDLDTSEDMGNLGSSYTRQRARETELYQRRYVGSPSGRDCMEGHVFLGDNTTIQQQQPERARGNNNKKNNDMCVTGLRNIRLGDIVQTVYLNNFVGANMNMKFSNLFESLRYVEMAMEDLVATEPQSQETMGTPYNSGVLPQSMEATMAFPPVSYSPKKTVFRPSALVSTVEQQMREQKRMFPLIFGLSALTYFVKSTTLSGINIYQSFERSPQSGRSTSCTSGSDGFPLDVNSSMVDVSRGRYGVGGSEMVIDDFERDIVTDGSSRLSDGRGTTQSGRADISLEHAQEVAKACAKVGPASLGIGSSDIFDSYPSSHSSGSAASQRNVSSMPDGVDLSLFGSINSKHGDLEDATELQGELPKLPDSLANECAELRGQLEQPVNFPDGGKQSVQPSGNISSDSNTSSSKSLSCGFLTHESTPAFEPYRSASSIVFENMMAIGPVNPFVRIRNEAERRKQKAEQRLQLNDLPNRIVNSPLYENDEIIGEPFPEYCVGVRRNGTAGVQIGRGGGGGSGGGGFDRGVVRDESSIKNENRGVSHSYTSSSSGATGRSGSSSSSDVYYKDSAGLFQNKMLVADGKYYNIHSYINFIHVHRILHRLRMVSPESFKRRYRKSKDRAAGIEEEMRRRGVNEKLMYSLSTLGERAKELVRRDNQPTRRLVIDSFVNSLSQFDSVGIGFPFHRLILGLTKSCETSAESFSDGHVAFGETINDELEMTHSETRFCETSSIGLSDSSGGWSSQIVPIRNPLNDTVSVGSTSTMNDSSTGTEQIDNESEHQMIDMSSLGFPTGVTPRGLRLQPSRRPFIEPITLAVNSLGDNSITSTIGVGTRAKQTTTKRAPKGGGPRNINRTTPETINGGKSHFRNSETDFGDEKPKTLRKRSSRRKAISADVNFNISAEQSDENEDSDMDIYKMTRNLWGIEKGELPLVADGEGSYLGDSGETVTTGDVILDMCNNISTKSCMNNLEAINNFYNVLYDKKYMMFLWFCSVIAKFRARYIFISFPVPALYLAYFINIAGKSRNTKMLRITIGGYACPSTMKDLAESINSTNIERLQISLYNLKFADTIPLVKHLIESEDINKVTDIFYGWCSVDGKSGYGVDDLTILLKFIKTKRCRKKFIRFHFCNKLGLNEFETRFANEFGYVLDSDVDVLNEAISRLRRNRSQSK